MSENDVESRGTRQLFALGCRLLAVYFLFQAFFSIAYSVKLVLDSAQGQSAIDQYFALFSIFMQFVLSLILLLKATDFAKILVPATTIEGELFDFDRVRSVVLISVLIGGLWFFLSAIPPIVGYFHDWFVGRTITRRVLEAITRFGLGLGVLLGATSLSDWLVYWGTRERRSWKSSLSTSPWMVVVIVLVVFLFVLMVQQVQ